jgi:hypothetical protein
MSYALAFGAGVLVGLAAYKGFHLAQDLWGSFDR